MIINSKNGDISVAARPANRYKMYGAFNPIYSHAGNSVTNESALGIPALLGGVNMIANTIASMGLQILDRNSPRGNQVVNDSFLAKMLRYRPNSDMTGFDYWHLVASQLLLNGNHYAAKILNKNGQIEELYPLKPDSVFPYRDANGRKVYRVRVYEGESFVDTDYTSDAILHVKGESWRNDSIVGDSVVSMARHILGAQIAQIEYQAKAYKDGMLIKGVLSTPENNINAETVNLIKQQWRSTYGGVGSAHDIAVLHSGVKFEHVSLSPEDAQFIQTRQWGNTDIAVMLGIPASRLNGETSSSTYKNQAQDDLFYYQQAVMPRVRRIEQALNADETLFGFLSHWEPRFNEKDVLRGDIETRFKVYEAARRIGVLSQNDIRDMEELPLIDGGDDYTPAGAGVNNNVPTNGGSDESIN